MANRTAPNVSDPTIKRALDDIYNILNDILGTTNYEQNESLSPSAGKLGDFKAVKDYKNKTYKIAGKTREGWVSVPAYLQTGTKGFDFKLAEFNLTKYDKIEYKDTVFSILNDQSGLNPSIKIGSTNNYSTFSTTDTGDLTIATVGAGTTDSDLTLDVDGDIELNADGGQVVIKDGATRHFDFDCDNTRFRMYDALDAADFSTISIGESGATIISTTDGGGNAGHLTLNPDGNILLYGIDGEEDSIRFHIGGETNQFAGFSADDVSFSQLRMYEMGGNSTVDYFNIKVEEHGETIIATADGSGAVAADLKIVPVGDLVLDPVSQKTIINATDKLYFDGGTETYIAESSADILDFYVGGDKILSIDENVDTGVTSLVGTLKIKEQATASADTAAYGQLWVDTATPNELAFTDDAGTDIIGIGKYHYESKVCNYYASVVANYIPLAGYVVERTSTANQNEYIAMVAPFNGTLHRVLWRSEADQDGTLEIDIFESPDETEVPGTLTGVKDTVLDRINDDISVEVNFASMTSGTNALVKGRIYAIKITCPSAPYDTNCTVVFKWDITS